MENPIEYGWLRGNPHFRKPPSGNLMDNSLEDHGYIMGYNGRYYGAGLSPSIEQKTLSPSEVTWIQLLQSALISTVAKQGERISRLRIFPHFWCSNSYIYIYMYIYIYIYIYMINFQLQHRRPGSTQLGPHQRRVSATMRRWWVRTISKGKETLAWSNAAQHAQV